jgi:ubiquinone/menaquinone biosynthesis C-methylase UbiE
MATMKVEEENKKVGVALEGSSVENPSFYDRMHLKMISLMHDSLYGVFVDPKKLLKAAGLRPGLRALEVGCGPGFFTIPAAQILETKGHLYSFDINPAAVNRVKDGVRTSGLSNVDVFLASAEKTGLPDACVDVAFLFGIIHSLKDLDLVLREMDRILRRDGILAVQKSSLSEKSLLSRITKSGLFHFVEKESRIYKFEKSSILSENTISGNQPAIED